MPPGGVRYTLVGFSKELDWKPLCFVEPLPKCWVCSACRLVRKRTALLACTHRLCYTCYEQSANEGARTCPRDGLRWEEEEVDWTDAPAEQLLKRQVRCWNEESGCEHVTMAAKICTHLQRECQHHSTRWPVCSDRVHCKDVIAHLNSGCVTTGTVPASQVEVQSSRINETALFMAFKGLLEGVSEQIKTIFGYISSDAKVQCDRLVELLECMDTFAERAEGQLGQKVDAFGETSQATSSSTGINLEKVTARVTRALKSNLAREATEEKHDKLMKGMRELVLATERAKKSLVAKLDLFIVPLASLSGPTEDITSRWTFTSSRNHGIPAQISPSAEAAKKKVKAAASDIPEQLKILPEFKVFRHEFTVRGINDLSMTARRRQYVCLGTPEPVYLRGYCVTPSLCLAKVSQYFGLYAGVKLHRGARDDDVRWPFTQKVKMTALHPNGHDEVSLEVRELCEKSFMQRPSESNDAGFYFNLSMDLRAMIKDGYVDDDEIRLQFELLP